MSMEKRSFGRTKEGTEVTLYTITNKNGMSVSAIDYGANIVSLIVPDKNGKVADIVLGFDDVAGYEENGCFFGAFIGRHGNRIGQAKFELGGTTYELEKNDGENNLHGGTPGYHHVMYEASATDDSVTFSRVSPDMEQGYPGNLEIAVTYALTEDNALKISYKTKSDKDTLCNLTNHSYFNLKGHDGGTITDHMVTIKVLAGGYDHNFVLDKPDGAFAKVCEVTESSCGRTMEVYTDLPGMQLYTGNFINREEGKAVYTKRTGICFETQFFPNSINVPEFKSCLLKAGEEFNSTTMYKFL